MNELIARVAYINAQTACMLAELEAMKAQNAQDVLFGVRPTFNASSFMALPDRFGIGHNAVIGYLAS